MSSHDLGQLEQLVATIDVAADRLRDYMAEFEGHVSPDGEIVEGVRFAYETLVGTAIDAIYTEYEQRGERPPPEAVREARARKMVERSDPTLAARYRALAGSIKVGQRWLAEKRAALSGLQSLNKTERDLAGVRS